jgi:voltage-gated potassium channel
MHIDVEKRFELWYERLSIFRAVATVISAAAVLVFLAGLLERLVEPETFTSLGLAYWWAVTTVTTVGYGDIVPESSWGRVVASGLMLVGLGLIPTLTSLIVATLVGKRTLEQQAQLDRQGKEHAAALERIEARLARLNEGRADDARGQG